MKKLQKSGSFIRGLAAGLGILACVTAAHAHPYASGVTNNGSGTISFVLNEQATTVTVLLTNIGSGNSSNLTIANGGLASTITNRGVQSFSLIQGANTFTNYSISVQKNGSGTFGAITNATGTPDYVSAIFNGPRGVAVNMNPQTHNFGRIYVDNASPGNATPLPPGDTGRIMGKGVFVLNADGSDALGYGTNSHPLLSGTNFSTDLTPNQGWGNNTTYSPFRLFVGPDDNVFVAEATLYTSGNYEGGSLWIMDPDLVTPTALLPFFGTASPNLAGNVGPINSRPCVTGSLAAGTLVVTCTEWLYGNVNNLDQYTITDTSLATLPNMSTPTQVGTAGTFVLGGFEGIVNNLYQGPISHEWYTVAFRSTAGAGNTNLAIFDVTGNINVWNGPAYGNPVPNDPFTGCYDVVVSQDEKYLAAVTSGGNILTCTITNDGTVWAPDVSTLFTNTTGLGGTARSIAFDAADNVVFVTGGDCVMRCFTLGLTTTAITSGDTLGVGGNNNGTFSFSTPAVNVSVTAVTNVAYRNQLLSTGSGNNGPSPGLFTLTRTGDTTSPLTVNISFAGTATNGTDYSLSPAVTTSITFAAGQSTTNVTLIPIHTGVAKPTTTAILKVAGGVAYATSSPNNTATVSIVDDASPVIGIASTTNTSMYEANQYDYSSFKLSRLGNTNATFTVNVTYTGTAAPARYNGPTTVLFNLGDVSQNLTNTPNNDNLLQGNQTIIATVATGTGYAPAVGSTLSATNTIIDDEVPAGTVLFSDDFNVDSSANYTLAFANAVGSPDYTATFAYDYSVLGIPAGPRSGGDTHGVYLTVNKTLTSGAGVNVYPTGSNFSGNFAMRFDMFLIENDTSFTTEYALFGIDHSGTLTNWFRNSGTGVTAGTTYDGLWCYVESDGAALGDYTLNSSPTLTGAIIDPTTYGSHSASTLTSIFKSPPYTPGAVGGGVPANIYSNTANYATPSWAQVEIDQVGTNVTLKINNTVIITYTNTAAAGGAAGGLYKNGTVMLGYDDAYDSLGTAGGSVIYDNLQVVRLDLNITSISVSGGNATIGFTWGLDDPTTSFALQTASVVTGPYVDNGGATIVKVSPGVYTATIATGGGTQFYRVRHK